MLRLTLYRRMAWEQKVPLLILTFLWGVFYELEL